MIQVRNGVFETNSSSTHSIAVQKAMPSRYPDTVYFEIGEYGWEFETVDPADYLYTAILCLYNKDTVQEKCAHIENVLSAIGVKCHFQKQKWKTYTYSDGTTSTYEVHADIDHGYETSHFVETLMSDDDMLIRFLCGSDSFVATGNDNGGYDENPMCYAAKESWHEYNSDTDEWEDFKNPNHDGEHFDYFFKGN